MVEIKCFYTEYCILSLKSWKLDQYKPILFHWMVVSHRLLWNEMNTDLVASFDLVGNILSTCVLFAVLTDHENAAVRLVSWSVCWWLHVKPATVTILCCNDVHYCRSKSTFSPQSNLLPDYTQGLECNYEQLAHRYLLLYLPFIIADN